MSIRTLLAGLLVCLLVLASATAAHGAFAGANGRIAFTSDPTGLDLEVYSMEPNGLGPANLSNNSNSDSTPSWSSDGTLILFSTDRDLNDEIYVMNANGSSPINLTNDAASDTVPAWSPDGQQIAFTRDDGSFDLEIMSMSSAGGPATNLSNNLALDTGAAWSPAGQKIAFTSTRDGNSEIYVMDANGSNPINRTNNAATDSGADWSPDGKKITFASRRDGNAEIYVMDADGSDPTRLTTHSASDFSPAWSPDGKTIAFRTNRDGAGYEIYVMNANGGPPTRLTNNTFLDTDPDWQPVLTYPRPGGGTPLRVPLVPAFGECEPASSNASHAPPLDEPSCTPPVLESSLLTIGTSGAASGHARLDAIVGDPDTGADEADLNIGALASDVRRRSDGQDHTGKLILHASIRITDRFNGFFQTTPATVQDLAVGVPMTCDATAASPLGSTCALSVTADALVPNTIREGGRSVISAFTVEVEDPGADGVIAPSPDPLGLGCPPTCGNGDEEAFLRQGVFTP